MNKTELIAAIAAKAGTTKTVASATLEAFMEAVTETLAKGDKVPLVGFGTFQISKREARIGRNPKSKEPLAIPAKNLARFKAGKKLDEAVNGKSAPAAPKKK